MPEISFSIWAVPVAQPRQRHRIVHAHGKAFATNYTPRDSSVQTFKATARMAAQASYQGPPLAGPLGLSVLFCMPRPSRLRWKKRAMPRAWHGQKPDADNLVKALKDSLSKLLWLDDAQIAQVSAVKQFASGDEAPHVDVRIWGLEDSTEVAAS